MPPTTDNSTDRAREDGNDAEWARWEQTFRDARPVLPELAMLRIEASMSREIDKVSKSPPRSRLRVRIFWLVFGLIAVNAIAAWVLMYSPMGASRRSMIIPGRQDAPHSEAGIIVPPVLVQDHYPLDVPIGPQLATPDLAIIPMSEKWDAIYDGASLPDSMSPKIVEPSRTQRDLLKAAEHLCGAAPNGWHALGLMEMRRAAGISAAPPPAFAPHLEEFDEVACWNLLPVSRNREQEFRGRVDRLIHESFQSKTQGATWAAIYSLYPYSQTSLQQIPVEYDPRQIEFPSAIANRARFDLLVELGVPSAQAGLDVLTTRSYAPLKTLMQSANMTVLIQDQPGVSGAHQQPLHKLYDVAAHDLIERLVLAPIVKSNESSLLQRARKLRYLTDPRDLAVLLARLGPRDAWEKLVRPLMENEIAFINHAPEFDDSGRRSLPELTVEGKTKSMQEGVTNYAGTITVAAGPWRIRCDKLAVYRNVRHGVLLIGSGNLHVRGVIGLYDATADEATLNTETGELKLSGRVHLDGWEQSLEANSRTIIRTGEVRP